MKFNRRRIVLAASLLALAPLAQAQQFPNKPIKIIYTYAPGGTGDALTRSLANAMSGILGQPVVVENRTGASGTVGVLAGARAPADGYTLMLTTITTVVQAPLVTKDASFDPVKSLAPIANLSVTPLVLLAHSSVPANDFPSFVEWAHTQASGVDMGVAGPTLEVATALLAKETKLKLVNIAYRGAAPALQALLAGEVKIFFNTPTSAIMEYIRQGKVRVLGVTSAQPSPLIPGGVPISKFVPGYIQDINFALWAPPGTPQDVVAKLGDAVKKALAEPGMAEKFHNMGTTLNPAGPEEVVRITQREAQNIKTIMETTNVKFGE
ncbi:MAG: tripartite tricarboxylate transporter substrate binding protein [Sulfuricaulis sp.]|nr:tripartite tricarboxylate transporter substrate binding protein [Sulfuricaulis sp.]